jgi:protein-tyrosine phosphatase
MIDIHSHILPGLDDGSPDIETSIEMAKMAVAQGITHMIATPHYIEDDHELEKQDVLHKVSQLNKELQDRAIDLEILPGEEVFITPNLVKLYEQGKLITLGGKSKYLLVELPLIGIPTYCKDVIYSLALKGLKVILAHPERNRDIALNPDKLRDFLRQKALVQVNTLSLCGGFGRRVQKSAQSIVNSGMAHFIATDCHTVRTRAPIIKNTRKIVPPDILDKLINRNPKKIIDNEDLEPSLPATDTKNKMKLNQKIKTLLYGFRRIRGQYN